MRIIDIDAEGLTQEKFIVELKKKPYGLVGMTTTTPTFHKAVALAKIVKDHAQAATVLGGDPRHDSSGRFAGAGCGRLCGQGRGRANVIGASQLPREEGKPRPYRRPVL